MCSTTFNCPRNEFVNGSVVEPTIQRRFPVIEFFHIEPSWVNSKSRGGAFGLARDDIEFLLLGWFSVEILWQIINCSTVGTSSI